MTRRARRPARSATTSAPPAPRRTPNGSVPLSQPGINQLANETGHLRVAVNFSWLLMTGFLVLFMQVGFAFLVTGLTRAKNAGHMMMMNLTVVRGRAHRVLRRRLRVPVRWRGAGGEPRRAWPADRIFPPRQRGLDRHPRLLPAERRMGTTSASSRCSSSRSSSWRRPATSSSAPSPSGSPSPAFLLAEVVMGAIIYPIYGNWVWGGGFLAKLGHSLHWGHGAVDFAGSGVVHATGGWAALSLAIILGPRIGKFNKDGSPNAFPGHNLGTSSSAPSSWCSGGWASTPAPRLARPTSASRSSR